MEWQLNQWLDDILRLFAAFLAGAAGIILWNRTREGAWTAVTLAAVFQYIDILIRFLGAIGLADLSAFSLWDFPVLPWIFGFLSSFSLFTAFYLGLRKLRRETL